MFDVAGGQGEDGDPSCLDSNAKTPCDTTDFPPHVTIDPTNSQMLSATQDIQHNESIDSPDQKDGGSKTLREKLLDENGQIIEEKDEEAFSDTIARDTNQETLQKLEHDVLNQKIDTSTIQYEP